MNKALTLYSSFSTCYTNKKNEKNQDIMMNYTEFYSKILDSNLK